MSNREQSLFYILIITLLGSGFALLLLRTIGQDYRQQIWLATQETLPIHHVKNATSSSTVVVHPPQVVWKLYKNTEFGFSLMLPQDKAYEVNKLPEGRVAVLSFEVPTKDPNWLAADHKTGAVFALIIYTYPQYQAMLSDCKQPENKDFFGCQPDNLSKATVGKSAKYYFIYNRIDQVDDYPSDFPESLFTQADEIIKTFKILN